MVRADTRILVALLALVVAAVPLNALAQPGPSEAPSYAAAPAANGEETIHGQIASFDGAGNLQLNDDRGFVDSVQLDPDTIVNPGGAQLQPGETVTIAGVARGSVFAANRIDVADQPPPAAPAGQPAAANVLTGLIRTALDSKNAYVGEHVTLRDVASADGAISGARLDGTVTDVTPPGQGRNAQIRMHFDDLRLPDGTSTRIDGVVVSIDVKTKSNAVKEIGGALAGMLAGNALAKTFLGVGGGGVLGAIGGFLIAQNSRADVVIPADTAVTVRLLNPRRQAR